MTELQRTFDGELLPTQRLLGDLIQCSDGKALEHRDVCYDCREGAHSNEKDCHDANVEIVTEILDGFAKWACEYTTENSDYADGAGHIVSEVSHDWPRVVEEWIDAAIFEGAIGPISDELRDELVEQLCANIDGGHDWDAEYSANEYSSYDDDGCCLWSMEIGEYEDQIEIKSVNELYELHSLGVLDDVLDDVNSDLYISRSKRRVKNEETGYYEHVGRDTYNPYSSNYPDLLGYTSPGGQWFYVVSNERMLERLTESVIDLCRSMGHVKK
jgi:hypothetical protein